MKIFTSFTIVIIMMLMQMDVQSIDLKINKYKGVEQSITRVRVASISVLPDKWDKAANWKRIESLTRKAASNGGARVVVTPEGALDGYVINEVNDEKEPQSREKAVQRFIGLAEPLDGKYIHKAVALSRELDIFFVLGFLEKSGEDLLNTVIMIDPDGDIIAKYSKTHFAQGYTINPTCYIPGNEYPVFHTPFGKVGILICYDRQLPEPARILAVKGAQVLFLPSYGSYDNGDGWNTRLLQTRAYENKFPLIFSHPYQSLLIDSYGDIEAQSNSNEVVYFEIKTDPSRYEGRFKNRRPDTYIELTESNN